jgi:acetyltransferase
MPSGTCVWPLLLLYCGVRELDAFFTPRSIAVVGASADPRKLGHIILANIVRSGFEGELCVVNPSRQSVLDRPAYASVRDVPSPPHLAIVVVPGGAVASIIDDCCAVGVRAAVVITAGFRETGAEGAKHEREIVARARAAGLRLIGPNSVGVINTGANLNATFAATAPLRQDVAVISQSGAVATAILDWARTIGVGFSKFVSLGNAADVTEVDLIDYLAADPETNTLVLYLEGFSDARRFVQTCTRVAKSKPIVAMKVGRSAAGARAATSHTGALASSDAVVDGAFRQAGVIRAYSLDELFDLTLAFSCGPLPAGPRVAVITNAGGPAVMAADAIERSSLVPAVLSAATRSALVGVLPPSASTANPIDILGDADPQRYLAAIDAVVRDEGLDAAIILLTPQMMTRPVEVARIIADASSATHRPIVASFVGGDAVASGRAILDHEHVATFPYPERAVRALDALWRYAAWRASA